MSVNKKNRSIWNSRYEAQRIYYQRKEINILNKKNNDLQQRIDKALEITNKILINNADNRMIANEEEKEYFDWLDEEMLNQERILKRVDN